MSLLKSNSIQIGQSGTATNNFTLSVPSSPDGTIKLDRGNAGDPTPTNIFTVDASGAITGATINGGSITRGTAKAYNWNGLTTNKYLDFTDIPSWVKKITVMFNGVSTNGTSFKLVQIGSGSIATANYSSISSITQGTQVGMTGAINTGFVVYSSLVQDLMYGMMVISNITDNIWVSNHTCFNDSTADYVAYGAGSSLTAISSKLDLIRITTVSGNDNFDAGSINIMYEG